MSERYNTPGAIRSLKYLSFNYLRYADMYTLWRLCVHKVRSTYLAIALNARSRGTMSKGKRGSEDKRDRYRGKERVVLVVVGVKGVTRERTRVFFHHQLLAASASLSRSETVKVPNSQLAITSSIQDPNYYFQFLLP